MIEAHVDDKALRDDFNEWLERPENKACKEGLEASAAEAAKRIEDDLYAFMLANMSETIKDAE